jgi:hypothetical protein
VPRKCKATFRNTNLPFPHLITSFACGSRTRGSPLLTAFGRMTGLQLDPTSEFPALVSTCQWQDLLMHLSKEAISVR